MDWNGKVSEIKVSRRIKIRLHWRWFIVKRDGIEVWPVLVDSDKDLVTGVQLKSLVAQIEVFWCGFFGKEKRIFARSAWDSSAYGEVLSLPVHKSQLWG